MKLLLELSVCACPPWRNTVRLRWASECHQSIHSHLHPSAEIEPSGEQRLAELTFGLYWIVVRLFSHEARFCAEARRKQRELVPIPTPHTRFPHANPRELADSALSLCTSYGDYQRTLPIIGAFMQCRPSNIDHMAWRLSVVPLKQQTCHATTSRSLPFLLCFSLHSRITCLFD